MTSPTGVAPDADGPDAAAGADVQAGQPAGSVPGDQGGSDDRPPPPGGDDRPPPPPPPGQDDERRKRRWTMAERLLAVLAAGLSVVAGLLGIWGAQASSERDDLETTTDSLAEERDQLGDELADAQQRIEELEADSTSTTTTTDPGPADDTTGTTGGGPGEPVYLNELEPVSGDADTRETELGGQRYRNVVRQELKVCGTPDVVEYNLGQDYARFTAVAGLHDTVEDPTDIWRFVVTTIDGQGEHVVFQQEVPFAQPAPVDVSVEGAQRLRLSIEEVEIGWTGSNCLIDDAPATWADPELT